MTLPMIVGVSKQTFCLLVVLPMHCCSFTGPLCAIGKLLLPMEDKFVELCVTAPCAHRRILPQPSRVLGVSLPRPMGVVLEEDVRRGHIVVSGFVEGSVAEKGAKVLSLTRTTVRQKCPESCGFPVSSLLHTSLI